MLKIPLSLANNFIKALAIMRSEHTSLTNHLGAGIFVIGASMEFDYSLEHTSMQKLSKAGLPVQYREGLTVNRQPYDFNPETADVNNIIERLIREVTHGKLIIGRETGHIEI